MDFQHVGLLSPVHHCDWPAAVSPHPPVFILAHHQQGQTHLILGNIKILITAGFRSDEREKKHTNSMMMFCRTVGSWEMIPQSCRTSSCRTVQDCGIMGDDVNHTQAQMLKGDPTSDVR